MIESFCGDGWIYVSNDARRVSIYGVCSCVGTSNHCSAEVVVVGNFLGANNANNLLHLESRDRSA